MLKRWGSTMPQILPSGVDRVKSSTGLKVENNGPAEFLIESFCVSSERTAKRCFDEKSGFHSIFF
jgi:hypothetical protein